MGRNFLLNVADHGYSAAGLDKDEAKAEALREEAGSRKVAGTTDMAEFVGLLRSPRRIMLLVPAGKAVDAVLKDLLPHLSAGDLIIDGGNSHFPDTGRRQEALAAKGILFLGVGVSGGAEGARRGPSIMPGGDKKAYQLVQPVLEAVAAKVDGDPCVAYMGNGAAGHYVKMVHNGIEYGLMQLIAEAYHLLRKAGNFTNGSLQTLFYRWNQERLQSFLIEITAAIFAREDDLGPGMLIDRILDKAKQKGTGKWTSQNAMDLGIPVPTIDAAVTMRGMSALKKARLKAMGQLRGSRTDTTYADREALERMVEAALYFGFVVTYAQGFALLAEASKEYKFDLDLSTTARIWRGGCIIRSRLLEPIRRAFHHQEGLQHLLLASPFNEELPASLPLVKQALKTGLDHDVPLLALSSAVHYFEAYRSGWLPLNLVQAQRDYFGSHTYERTDREGTFHTEW